MARGSLHTTTARFDADTWAEILAESDRLGVAHAEYIRGAVLRRLAGAAVSAEVASVERRVDALAERVDRIVLRITSPRRSL